MKKYLLSLMAVATLLCSCVEATVSENSSSDEETKCCDMSDEITTPDQALAALKAGNERFVAGERMQPRDDTASRLETVDSQSPFAAIIACSDSRVPVEHIFDHSIGDLFVIRTAGNSVIDNVVMGSVDYAIDHLNVPLVMVLGHQNCGGVTSAITATDEHSHHNGQIGALIESIQYDVEEYIGHPEQLDEAIEANTLAQLKRIKEVDYIKEKIASGKLKVVCGYYNFETGRVESIYTE